MKAGESEFVALIDADVLRYEVGFGVQWKDEEGEQRINSFDSAVDLLEQKVHEILGEVGTELPPIMYLTADTTTYNMIARNNKRMGVETPPFSRNYREEIAISRGYKGNRGADKPFHYANLTGHLLANYDVRVAIGYEADDLISITANTWSDDTTPIICSRDKDLRITPGWHFGWTCGGQPQFGPRYIDPIGFLELKKDKLTGGGLKFFYSQLITGDKTDNIPGLPRGGPVLAYNTLNELNTEAEMLSAVVELYKDKMKDGWETYLKEQSDLLWICQQYNNNGDVMKKVLEI